MQATTEKLMLAQMAKEAREFNYEWEKIMKAIMADRHVLPTAQIAGIVLRCVGFQSEGRQRLSLETTAQFLQAQSGTGKTENVKDLPKALGMYCINFNFSEGLDHTSVGRMFSGLAQTGAWSCFDEFNPAAGDPHCSRREVIHSQFEGRTIPIKETCGVFVTMPPGYPGRSKLPDNLKALFRPVAMMVPDSAMIAQIRLYAEGFTDPVTLAQKIDTLYTLSMQQLSRRAHYDWGLRAIKSVLVTAGTYHRQAPEQTEDVVPFRACMNMNYPKLLADDLRLFQGLLGDLFPTVQLPSTTSSALIDAIKACLVESPEHLQIHQALINTIVQFSETKDIRHGVMMVGESGSYKSTAWKKLAAAKTCLNAAGVPVDANDELFGFYDKTSEWNDGIVSNLVMRAANDESMNSVVDDSKVLTLTNQTRITFPQQVSFLFEVQDLQEASHATVYRCCIIFMDTANFGWQPFIRSWVERKEMDENNGSQQRGSQTGVAWIEASNRNRFHIRASGSPSHVVLSLLSSFLFLPLTSHMISEVLFTDTECVG
ncbi:putative Dynein axonemal heavy chain 2 [Blattamonas nauphoetae]|uniref:Dynein axonemal heavy chain 2 n=1 Tax=Blattamonas nauphoetae TaxID=2049346 RepID=A0ABQ9WYS0_9EUKA|nr:putative Dynein axonemal heavy chain 2 [Blattamonas nauphoetae]